RHRQLAERCYPDRHHSALRSRRGAPHRLDHRLVRRHVEGDDQLRLGGNVRALRIFLQHQRPWMVNSSFTFSVSAAVRFASISGLSMVTVFPPESPSPTTIFRKLAGEALFPPASARLVAANSTLFTPGWR